MRLEGTLTREGEEGGEGSCESGSEENRWPPRPRLLLSPDSFGRFREKGRTFFRIPSVAAWSPRL